MKRIVMLGSAREVRGGVSAMVNVCFEQGLFERWDAEYLATHCDGSKPRKALRAAVSFLRFAALVATGRVELVHVHISSDASFWRKAAFVGLARALAIPYILHVHAGDFSSYYEHSSPVTRSILRWLYAGAERVIALSASWKPAIEAVVPGARVVVIPNPVTIPPWSPQLAAAPPRVLFLGVVRPEKGVYELLAAWPHVVAAIPGAHLVMAGSGEIERARGVARELGIAGSVDFPGWVGPTEKARLLEKASVLVLPSHFEALPMAVLEGMAAGLPIVATRVGAIPDAVGPDAGILVPPRDPAALGEALVATLSDDSRRIAMGAAARLRASAGFSSEIVVPAIERLWAEVAPHAKRTSPMVGALP